MTRKRIVVVIIAGVFTTVLVVVAGMLAAGQVARLKMARQFPAPGMMVTSGDHQLHVFCEGSGPVTVLVQAGLNNFSVHWRQLQSRLSKHAKTCVLDRAGMGWSEATSSPSTLANMVADMDAVATAVAPTEPLVLVGHSYGGIVVRAYAQAHPGHIKAMVLVDPANEFMADQIHGYAEVLAKVSGQFKTLDTLALTGLMALQPNNIPTDHLTGNELNQYRAVLATGDFFNGASKETGAMINNLQAMRVVSQNEVIKWPVVIISRGQPDPIPGLPAASAKSLEQTWRALQADLVKRMRAKQVIAEKSSHSIQLTQPELIYDAVVPFLK